MVAYAYFDIFCGDCNHRDTLKIRATRDCQDGYSVSAPLGEIKCERCNAPIREMRLNYLGPEDSETKEPNLTEAVREFRKHIDDRITIPCILWLAKAISSVTAWLKK